MAVILGSSLALWAIFLALSEIGHVTPHIFLIPLLGIALCVVYDFFMIRCPFCGKNLGAWTRSLTNFSLFRFPKRVRFCPRCTIDFEDDVKSRRKRTSGRT